MITYEVAVKELYYSIYGSNPTNYHAVLYQLINKADMQNKELLRLAYPMEVHAYEEWESSKSQMKFFSQFGFKVPIE
jgi:hypothetical protein